MEKDALTRSPSILLIGGSAGSLEVLLELVASIRSARSYALVIIIHRKSPESRLVEVIQSRTALRVKEVEEKESILPGLIYIAPADYHLLIESDRSFSLDYSEKVNYSRPSIDVSFELAAELYGRDCAAILLSGASADGARGLQAIAAAGGCTIVQDPATAIVGFMPQSALDIMQPDLVGDSRKMIEVITGWK